MSISQTIAKDGTITFSISTKLEGSFLQQEEQIQEIVNELGKAATQQALMQLDVSEQSIKVSDVKYSRKGQEKKSIIRPLV